MLSFYQGGHVFRDREFPQLEAQMCSFPNVLDDDIVDAMMQGCEYFLKAPAKRKPTAYQGSYG